MGIIVNQLQVRPSKPTSVMRLALVSPDT